MHSFSFQPTAITAASPPTLLVLYKAAPGKIVLMINSMLMPKKRTQPLSFHIVEDQTRLPVVPSILALSPASRGSQTPQELLGTGPQRPRSLSEPPLTAQIRPYCRTLGGNLGNRDVDWKAGNMNRDNKLNSFLNWFDTATWALPASLSFLSNSKVQPPLLQVHFPLAALAPTQQQQLLLLLAPRLLLIRQCENRTEETTAWKSGWPRHCLRKAA